VDGLLTYCTKKKYLSLKWTRKLCNSVSMFLPAIFFMLVSVLEVRTIEIAVVLVCFGYGFTGFSHSGYLVNMIDIGKIYSGQILGIANTAASIPGILGNTITGQIVEKTGSYDTVFITMVTAYLFGGSIFLIYSDSRTIFD